MGVNKFVMNTANGQEVKFDLTGDTVTPETLAEGVTAHNASGDPIVGTMSATGGSGVLIVNITQNGTTWVADKTHAELLEAYSQGKMLYANARGQVVPVMQCTAGDILFYMLDCFGANIRAVQIYVLSDDSVRMIYTTVALVDINFGTEYAGQLLYVGEDGMAAPLRLGTGLKIENGVLMLDGTVTPDTPVTPSKTAICGTFLVGEVLCGEGV